MQKFENLWMPENCCDIEVPFGQACLKSRFWSGSAAGCEARLCLAVNFGFDVGSALYLANI